jgi:hypothetical protein
LRNLPEGVYFLRVNKVKTKKLIIKKWSTFGYR